MFSSALGWGVVLDQLFPRGLMLLDFDEHRLHRRTLSIAFKAEPMRSYLAGLNTGIAKGLAHWPRRREFKFYPAIKQLTLDLAATSFLGGELGPEVEAVKRAFVAMVAASISVIRAPLPGTRFSRGVRGRALLADYFNRQIPLRRERGGGDLFSQLCRATWEDGTLLSNADIVGHMNFLMMAAHDTLTSSLTSFIDRLAANPDWQEKLRAEHRGLGLAPDEPLPYDRLDELALTEMAFKEALRLMPPVPSIPRRALRARWSSFSLLRWARAAIDKRTIAAATLYISVIRRCSASVRASSALISSSAFTTAGSASSAVSAVSAVLADSWARPPPASGHAAARQSRASAAVRFTSQLQSHERHHSVPESGQTQPPSTTKFCAEHMRALSEARKITIVAMSCGCTRPARHWLRSINRLASSSTQRSSCRFVITHPGTTVLTRILCWPSSRANERVMPCDAAFAAV
jgi:hypothetical protein